MLLFTLLAPLVLLAWTCHSKPQNASMLEQGVGPLLSCRLVYQNIVIISTISTQCQYVGLEDLPYHAMIDAPLLTGVRLTMTNCGYQVALVRSPTNCTLIFADDDTEDVISRPICDSLADPNLVLLCHIPPTIIKTDRVALEERLLKAQIVELEAEQNGCATCPSARSGTCPCCPGPGEPVILYKFVPHHQADCACRQLGLTPLPLADNPAWQREVARRLTDCTGRSTPAWVSGRPDNNGLCMAFAPSAMTYKHNNVPIYRPAWRPCNTTMPVVCRAPTDQQDYTCYQCRFQWSPMCCRCPGFGRSRQMWAPRDICFLPDVCATDRGSSESSSDSSDSDSHGCKHLHEEKNYFASDCDYRSKNFDCDRCVKLFTPSAGDSASASASASEVSEEMDSAAPDGKSPATIVDLGRNHFLVFAMLTSREAADACTKHHGLLATVAFDTIAQITRSVGTLRAWTTKGMYVKMGMGHIGSVSHFGAFDPSRKAAALCVRRSVTPLLMEPPIGGRQN